MKKLKNEMRWKINKKMEWSWFQVPAKVEQIIEYLFSDTVQSQQQQKKQGWNKPRSIPGISVQM